MRLVSVVVTAMVVSGCSTTYIENNPSNPRLKHFTSASLKQEGRNYEVLGLVHCERWSSAFYWMSDPARMRHTLDDLNNQASRMGADAVVDVKMKAENHYQFALVVVLVPFIFNSDETHVSGTAVKWAP